MTISEIVQSTAWKAFMGKLYGFGAAIVIIGALFKIQHWPGASYMLTVGLLTEAIIFFFSAFEPLHEEVDWTLVYPELAGISDDDEMENYKEAITSSRGNVVLEKFENLIESSSSISPEVLEKLGEGFVKLNSTTKGLSDISEATAATQMFVGNFKNAAQSLDTLTTSYSENSEVLKTSIGSLSNSYSKTAEIIEKSGSEIANNIQQSGSTMVNSYQKLSESIGSYTTNIADAGKNYGGELQKLNKSVTDLNSLYELQLKNTNDFIQHNQKMYSGLDKMINNLNESVNETTRYRAEMVKLSDSLASLNNIYGNMLSAMNVTRK
jgi:gliding motility-associated protein GldL